MPHQHTDGEDTLEPLTTDTADIYWESHVNEIASLCAVEERDVFLSFDNDNVTPFWEVKIRFKKGTEKRDVTSLPKTHNDVRIEYYFSSKQAK